MANLQTIVEIIATANEATKKETEALVRQVFATVQDQLVTEGELSIPGFGVFRVKETEARTGRNPQTGEALEIAASKKVSFKVAKGLKDAVKGA